MVQADSVIHCHLPQPDIGREGAVGCPALACHFPAELDRTLDLLTRRELIEPADGGYRFQVKLIRRWFAQ